MWCSRLGSLMQGIGNSSGLAFVVDSKMENHYKETVRGICQTLRRADDFNQN